MRFLLTKLGEGEEALKKWTRILFLLGIAVTFVFLLIITVTGISIRENRACGANLYGAHIYAHTSNSSYVLNNDTDYVLQEFTLNTSRFIRYSFCYDVWVNSTTGEQLEIINEEGDVLATEYAIIGLRGYCTSINVTKNKVYLGLQCPTCTPTRTIILREITAGDNRIQVLSEDGVISVGEDSALSYTLRAEKSCKSYLRYMLWAYIWVLVALGVIMLIFIGFRKLEYMLFEDIKL